MVLSEMFVANIRFGAKQKKSKEFYEELVVDYIDSMYCNGQLCGDYFYVWTDKILNAYVNLTHPKAFELKYHTENNSKRLKTITQFFGKEPDWILIDDEIPSKSTNYKNVPFLFLHTNSFRPEPSIKRGDNGRAISPILLPISPEVRFDLYLWEKSYRLHDSIWIECSKLEIPAYKQLVEPDSTLSESGRDLCTAIEKATGIPTYYYLARYWGRKKGEKFRKCPSCGNQWHLKNSEETQSIFRFLSFKCDKCRLVSRSAATEEDDRHARLGEFKKTPETSQRATSATPLIP